MHFPHNMGLLLPEFPIPGQFFGLIAHPLQEQLLLVKLNTEDSCIQSEVLFNMDSTLLNDPQLALSVATFLPFLVLVYALDLLA